MKEFDPMRECLFDYITVVAEMTFSIAVIGSIFMSDANIRFYYFYIPFILSLICMLPCIPIYLKEDMTIRQVLIQRGVELVVLEFAMFFATKYLTGDRMPKAGYVAVVISTAFFQTLSYLIKWYLEKEEADKINRKLQEHRTNRKK